MARAIFPAHQSGVVVQPRRNWSLTWPANWRYQIEGSRDVRLDFLRGFCMFVIIADHISYYPAFTMFLTGGGYFLVSAAEGFIFISGFVVGMVYGARILKEGLSASTNKILHRAWQLYLWNFIVAMAYLGLAYFTPLHTRKEAVAAPPEFNLDLIFKILTLREGFGWSDLLATYAVLMAVAPVILYFLVQKRTKSVLLVSWGLWGCYQVSPQNFSPQIGSFPILAWQLLFVNGLLLGYHREQVKEFFSKWPRWMMYVPLVISFAALLALGISWIYAGAFGSNNDLTWYLNWLFDKMALRPGRVLAFLVFFEVMYLALTYFWEPMRLALGWLFNPIGQNSLYVYILHGFVISVFFNIPDFGDMDPWLHTMGHITAFLAMWMLVKSRFMFRIIPR